MPPVSHGRNEYMHSDPRLRYRRLSPRLRGNISATAKHRTVRWTISAFAELPLDAI